MRHSALPASRSPAASPRIHLLRTPVRFSVTASTSCSQRFSTERSLPISKPCKTRLRRLSIRAFGRPTWWPVLAQPSRCWWCRARTAHQKNAIPRRLQRRASRTKSGSYGQCSDSMRSLMVAALRSIIGRMFSSIESSIPGNSPPREIRVSPSLTASNSTQPLIVIGPS